MSMNLVARTVVVPIILWQTPTWVTYACLMDSEGRIGQRSGMAAKRAMHIYLAWVVSHLDVVYRSTEEFEAAKKVNDKHVRYIRGRMSERGLVVDLE